MHKLKSIMYRERFAGTLGAGLEGHAHVPGCASSSPPGWESLEFDGAFECATSPISIMTSPRKVDVSVFVGDTGVRGVFSSANVSSVLVRDGAILAGREQPPSANRRTRNRWGK